MPEGGARSARAILWGPLTRNRRLVAGSIPLITLWQVCEALVPVMIGVTIDVAIASGRVRDFALSCLVLAIVFACLSYGYRFGATFATRAVEDESHRIRLEIAEKSLTPVDDPKLAGEWLSLATADADLVSTLVRQVAFTAAALTSVTAAAIYLAQIDPVLAVVIGLGLPVTVALTQLLSPVVARRTNREQAAIARVAGLAGDLVAGLRPLKGIGGERTASGRYRAASRAARGSSIVTARSWGYMTGLTTLVSGAFLALVTWLAAVRAIHGDLTLGELVAVVGLTQFLAEPIGQFGDLSARFAASRASARRLHRALGTPSHDTDGSEPLPSDAVRTLEYDRVTTGPLSEVSLRVEPGEIVAIVADAPEAADALIGLLDGTERPATGRVSLAGVELHRLRRAERVSALLAVPHDATPPEGTVRSAIDPDGRLGDDELAAVLTASAAHDVVESHPDGLEHHVRSGGSSLSGGQRQRLTLARALAATPSILVLRDPTTAIDSVTEQQIAAGLAGRAHSTTATLIVTSSPTLLAIADRVVWIRGGRVAAVSTHADLQRDPSYVAEVLQ